LLNKPGIHRFPASIFPRVLDQSIRISPVSVMLRTVSHDGQRQHLGGALHQVRSGPHRVPADRAASIRPSLNADSIRPMSLDSGSSRIEKGKVSSFRDEGEESVEARIERLGRQRPATFKSIWSEVFFVFSIMMSQLLAVSPGPWRLLGLDLTERRNISSQVSMSFSLPYSSSWTFQLRRRFGLLVPFL